MSRTGSRPRTRLLLWRDNDAQLQPLLPESQLTQGSSYRVGQSASSLADGPGVVISATGENTAVPQRAGRAGSSASLKTSAKPQAVLLNMIAPPVAKLVQATAKRPLRTEGLKHARSTDWFKTAHYE